MAVIWKGGPAHRAPYATTHVRVPVPIKGAVQKMVDDYKRGALADCPATDTAPDIQAAIAILTHALTLKANAGGKIKIKIKEALAILEDA